jgi:hypothetical protein
MLCPSCGVVSGGRLIALTARDQRQRTGYGDDRPFHAADVARSNGILRGPGSLGSPSSVDFRYDIYTVTRPEAAVLYGTATYPGPLDRKIRAGVCPIHFLRDLVRCG